MDIPYEPEKKFTDKQPIKKYPYDIWIPEQQIIIELDGEQHFTDKISFFEKHTSFGIRIKRDNIKNEGCLKNHWPILRIPHIYDPERDEKAIRSMVENFVRTGFVPKKIIDYYAQYEFSNYCRIANILNEWVKERI